MKKRKGFLFLEALAALLLMSALAAALFPLAGQASSTLVTGEIRGRMGETGLFALDLMVEKIRNNRRPMPSSGVRGSSYGWYGLNEYGREAPYIFYEDGEKLKIQLYNDMVQPITGGGLEEADFESREGSPLFRQEAGGPVHISFRLHRQLDRMQVDYETSVIPYADFYRKGKVYE